MDTEYHLVLFRLASSRIEIHHEYFMYDMVSVVSSIGGGIGIFLDYSFFGILFGIISGGIGAILAVSYIELSSDETKKEESKDS